MKKLVLTLFLIIVISFQAQVLPSKILTTNSSKQQIIDIDFASVENFILFTVSGAVANTGISNVTGNIGSNLGVISGFGLPSILNGTIENANTITAQASLDLVAACVQLQAIPATITNHPGIYGNINIETIFPGVYSSAGAVSIAETLVLDAQGDPDAMFIFKIGGALTSVAGATVELANGATSDNVYWIAVGAVALGAGTTMVGTVIAYPGAVSLGAGGAIDGRLYSSIGAIAINGTIASIPSSTSSSYNFLGTYTSNGTPLYLEDPSDVVSSETLEVITNSLPDNYPVPDYNPQYITSSYDTDIKIEATADIFVTFVREGDDYNNAFGYYTYDINSPLTSPPAKEDITIIFPNVSAEDSGGGLQIGDKVKIGTFEAGTGIGFVLLVDGWSSTQEDVLEGELQLYSDIGLNPESDESLRTHNVILNDPTNERLILGFEDIRRDDIASDQDFNDAIFYISTNSYTAINTSNFADIDSATDVTSANDGGLESNGDLATKIAKRNFKRAQTGEIFNQKKLQPKFTRNTYASKNGQQNISLENLLPETGMFGTERPFVSSPADLLGITNAKEIFSVDYYQGEKRVSAVFATQTEGAIYDHSKVICDRLNGSNLLDVRTVMVRNHKLISSKIQRATEEVEYTLSFSIKLDDTKNELFSFWNIAQYPEGNYYNFQIWGGTFSQVFSIANHILDTLSAQKELISNSVEDLTPSVFVKSGSYLNGIIRLNIINKTAEKALTLNANIAKTETSERTEITETISLSGNWEEEIHLTSGVLFDLGLSLRTEKSQQKDALYLADGPWGTDFLDDQATLETFNVTDEATVYTDNTYEIERAPKISGQVKGNINLFRHLLPGDQTLDVTSYQTLEFFSDNNHAVEIILVPENFGDWSTRLRYTIPANNIATFYSIPFSDFKDHEGKSIIFTNIKTIVFSIIHDYKTYLPFNLSLKNVAFNKTVVLAVEENNINPSLVLNYPNPFTNRTTIQLATDTKSIQIQVIDLLGRVVDHQKIEVNTQKKAIYNAPKLTSGIYKYLFTDNQKRIFKGTFLIE
jgi:hypothetical protein